MERKLRLDANRMERRLRKVGTWVDADVVAALLAEIKDLERRNADLETLLEQEANRP
jgi:hypothetical protein